MADLDATSLAATDAPEPTGIIYAINPAGETVTIPAARAQDAIAQGYGPATPDQIAAFQRQEWAAQAYGTVGQQILAGAESAASALTFGASTAVERALGVPVEDIRAREEQNPITSGIGTAAGIIAPLLITGGTSAPAQAGGRLGAGVASTALRGAAELTAPAAIARVGAGAARLVDDALPQATGLLGRAARGAAVEGARGATEGALYGAGQVVHEAALGDPDLTFERAATTIGMGTLLGGGLGTALGIAPPVLSSAVKTTRDAIAGAFRKGEEALGAVYRRAENLTGVEGDVATFMIQNKLQIQQMERTTPGIADDLSHATPEMAKFVVDNADRFNAMEQAFPGTTRSLARADIQTAERMLNEWPKIMTDQNQRNVVARDFFDGGKSVIDATNDLLRQANKEILPAERAELIAQIRGIADRKKVEVARQAVLDRVDSAIRTMKAEPDLYSASYVRDLELMGEGLARDLAPPKKGWLPAEDVFERLRTFKQQTGELADFGKARLGMSKADQNATKVIAGVWGATKDTLRDETIFGPAALRLGMFDDIQHEWISLTGKKGAFYKRFMEQGEKGPQISPQKISRVLNQMANPRSGQLGDLRGAEDMATWGRFMDTAKRVVNELDQSSRTAKVTIDADSYRDLILKAEQAATTAQERASITLLKAGLEGRTLLSSHPIVAGQVAGDVASVASAVPVIGGTLETTVNFAKKAVSVPRAVSVLATIHSAAAAATRKLDSLASTLVRAGVKAANVGRAEVVAGLSASHGKDYKSALSSYERKVSRIRALAQNPDLMHDHLVAATDDLHEHAPKVAQAAQIDIVRKVAYLKAQIQQRPDTGPLGPKLGPTRAEIAAFDRAWDVANDWTVVVKQAAAGMLHPESIRAAYAMAPKGMDALRASVFEQLVTHGKPPRQQRIMLSMLLAQDLDGSLAQLAANQATFRRANQGEPGAAAGAVLDPGTGGQAGGRATPARAGALNLASRTKTEMQRTGGR